MAATALLPKPVDTSGDGNDPDHVACPVKDVTYCGIDAREFAWTTQPISVDAVCRVCVLAVEMMGPDDPCPVCGTHACLTQS